MTITDKTDDFLINYIKQTIKEFFSSLKKPYSYSIYRNPYCFFGFLWGLPIPFTVIGTYLLLQGNALNTTQAFHLLNKHPWLWLFPLHPLIFAIIFGLLGTIRKQKQDEITSLIQNLNEQANTDGLTGLYTRRYFMNVLDNEFLRSQRNNVAFCIILFDIDNFKKINDHHGHIQGDEVLKKMAHVFNDHTRPYDTSCRWGGEEFIMLLPNTNTEEACVIANRIRSSFAEQIFIKNTETFHCTLSAGVSEFNNTKNHTITEFIDQADQALYHAKTSGKNCIKEFSNCK